MPGLDGTGPLGQGPMTGRGLGLCGGTARRRSFVFGAGCGGIPWGCGRGRVWGGGKGSWGGFRRAFYPVRFSASDEKTYLENAMKDLEEELNAVKKRLEELEGK